MIKATILTFVHYYLPGYKSGGPVRTIANMVDHLGEEFDFRIVTADRDALDDTPYQGVSVDNWNQVGKAQVYYASPANRSPRKLAKLIAGTAYDVLYLNSFFDPVFTLRPLLARWLDRLPDRPVIIASRGEFSPGALALKSWKKRPYLFLARFIGFYRNLVWQASSEDEERDIRRNMGTVAQRIVVAPNISSPCLAVENGFSTKSKRCDDGTLRVVFLSRISPMKNLDFALRVLTRVQVPVEFNIYGPINDKNYWKQCKALMSDLPQNVSVRYVGSLEHSKVISTIAAHDLFFLPTRGENYGHVILEAMAAGTPVLIANTTHWLDLEKAGVGWDLPLDDELVFAGCIERAAKLQNDEYVRWRGRVRAYARERLIDLKTISRNRRLFLETAGNFDRIK